MDKKETVTLLYGDAMFARVYTDHMSKKKYVCC